MSQGARPATVTAAERRRFDRQAKALAFVEIDDEGSPDWRAAMIDTVDRRRAAWQVADRWGQAQRRSG